MSSCRYSYANYLLLKEIENFLMPETPEEATLGPSAQTKLDENLNDALATSRPLGLNVLVDLARKLDVDPKTIELLEKEKEK